MRFVWLLQVAVILFGPSVVYGWLHRRDAEHALSGSALVLAGVYTVVAGAFVVGSAFADPGGWGAVAFTAGWLVTAAALVGALYLIAGLKRGRAGAAGAGPASGRTGRRPDVVQPATSGGRPGAHA